MASYVAKILLIVAALFSLVWGSPPISLALGIGIALLIGNPLSKVTKPASKWLLQAAVVLLGFSMDLPSVLEAGSKGILFALLLIAVVFGAAWLLARVLRVDRNITTLVASGTAICGGSAIAAMASVIDPKEEEVSVSIGTVFLLNAVALYAFPVLGRALDLSQAQFGIWAGIAIHDVSSVVGASAVYGPEALEVATAVKLSRVLYIVPLVLVALYLVRRERPGQFSWSTAPWFIGLFLLAAALRSASPAIAEHAPTIKTVAIHAFSLTLFLIGAGITSKALAQVGFRPLMQGLLLWLLVSIASLAAIYAGVF